MAQRKSTRKRSARKPRASTSDLVMREDPAAALLLLSVRTLQRWRVEGRGPRFLKLGKIVVYRRDDLEAWLASCSQQSTSESGPRP